MRGPGLCSLIVLPVVFPVPRKEFVELALRRPGDLAEDVGEPGLRMDIVELGGADEHVHRRRPLAARTPPRSEPQNSQDFLPKTIARSFLPFRAGLRYPLSLAYAVRAASTA